jgi:hypothetical protein
MINNLLLFTLLASSLAFTQQKPETKTQSIADKITGSEKFAGYFTFYWNAKEGKLWLQIDKWDVEFLYVNSLPAGVGSNDIGLDRGQLGGGRVVKFQRTGPRVLLIQPNYDYRALTDKQDERRAVEESFAQSVLWGFDVVAEEGNGVLVDATNFYLRDAHDVVGTLKRTNQGSYRLDPSRCALYLAGTKNFPLNSEVEVTLTFTGDEPGNYVQQVVPTPQAITVRQHHSFVQLPDPGYTPRAYDPRAGYGMMSYFDYASPIDEPVAKRFISRHRLWKKDPAAPVSEPVKPIVYYLDRGTPEPIRSALLEGARWWNQAFEAAGYKDAFRVEMMPEGADPMDVRYNLIQWVHRSTRGWSYGASISDPRTGEIIKGHVSLGSLRVRQDFLIAQGLVAEFEEGKTQDPAMLEMALARLRQLSAHEVGHTLGLMHNYIASTANRASVMDYPHPLVTIKNDSTLDLSDAYAAGIGEWDKVAIAYGYQDFPAGTNETAALNKIITDAAKRGIIFLTDQDARPQGSSHPQTHLWDNGINAVDELTRIMKVRSIALRSFSEKRIRPGMPMATLEDVIVPVYMGHRYQVEAAVKLLGGLKYTYALRGDGQMPTEMVPPQEQLRALDALLATLKPDALALPEKLIAIIPPHPAGYDRGREDFKLRTWGTFDPISAGETAANLTVSLILHPARAARLVEFHALDNKYPAFTDVIDRIFTSTWYSTHGSGYDAELRRTVDDVVLYQLMSLANNAAASTQSRAIATLKIAELKDWLTKQLKQTKDEHQRAHFTFALSQVRLFEQDPKQLNLTRPLDPPDGPPIGSFDCDIDD